MKKELKGFICGVLFTASILSIYNIYAGNINQSINVFFKAVNIRINFEPKDINSILYNGTTYVPLRTISNNLNNDVEWNEPTKTVSIFSKDLSPRKYLENKG